MQRQYGASCGKIEFAISSGISLYIILYIILIGLICQYGCDFYFQYMVLFLPVIMIIRAVTFLYPITENKCNLIRHILLILFYVLLFLSGLYMIYNSDCRDNNPYVTRITAGLIIYYYLSLLGVIFYYIIRYIANKCKEYNTSPFATPPSSYTKV